MLLALLVAGSLHASPPPVIWFQDNFDSRPIGKLAYCSPGWYDAQVIEPGNTAPWSVGTTDVNVRNNEVACSGEQYVVMQGFQGGWASVTLWDPRGIAAETNWRYAPLSA